MCKPTADRHPAHSQDGGEVQNSEERDRDSTQ